MTKNENDQKCQADEVERKYSENSLKRRNLKIRKVSERKKSIVKRNLKTVESTFKRHRYNNIE